MGAIGMSLQDFVRLRPCEFHAIAKAYGDREESKERLEWERMRMLASIMIQPHTKRKVTPDKLLPLPWDKEKAPKAERVEVSKEEREARIKTLMQHHGGKKDNDKA